MEERKFKDNPGRDQEKDKRVKPPTNNLVQEPRDNIPPASGEARERRAKRAPKPCIVPSEPIKATP